VTVPVGVPLLALSVAVSRTLVPTGGDTKSLTSLIVVAPGPAGVVPEDEPPHPASARDAPNPTTATVIPVNLIQSLMLLISGHLIFVSQ